MAKSKDSTRALTLVDDTEDGPHHFTIGGYTVGRNGILAQRGTGTYEEWELFGQRLSVVTPGLAFIVGDWLNVGEDKFSEMASQAIDAASWSLSTTNVYKWVAANVPLQNRRMDKGLSFRHHMEVAKLSVREQKKWLDKALGDEASGAWSVKRLKDAIDEGQDLPEVGWFVVVTCDSAADMAKFIKQTELAGKTCKASVRRGRKAVAA